MDKEKITESLADYKKQLHDDVLEAYSSRGDAFGRERFEAWRKRFSAFLDTHLPGESQRLKEKLHRMAFGFSNNESPVQRFWREYGEDADAFIDSLLLDFKNNIYTATDKMALPKTKAIANSPRIFIVHGHDSAMETKAARFIEKIGYKPVILHEQASKGKTIIEKIEAEADVGFAIVLYTPDDAGNSKAEAAKCLNDRARQNVVFEHGYLIARLGRSRVVPLVNGKIELPSDISGVVYVSGTNWEFEIAKEMKSVGYTVDLNKLA